MAHKHLCGLALISLHVIIISSINCLLRKFHLMPQSGWRTLFVLLQYIMLIGSEHSEHEWFVNSVQSFPASGSFQMSQFFTSGGQSIGVSVSTSVLPVTAQDWSPLGWTGWISLQSKGLSKVFTNTTVQKHQFFGAQNWFVVCN